ncbi:succinylglutamate desuccinylase/aspartoacylase family protein, partial [Patescibacteria group bacterium]
HGDESLGVEVLEELEKERGDFDWTIGNPKAFKIKKRKFENDLNRSAPGDPKSSIYEQRRASELITRSKQYQYTIDLHGTVKNTGIFIIITNPTEANLKLAGMLGIDKIVIWPSFSPELEGPLSEYFPCGLEIECGPKNSPQIKQQLKNCLLKFLETYQDNETKNTKELLANKQVFEVYGSLGQQPEIELKEFQKAVFDGEMFFPLLIGSYDNLFCYKMKQVKEVM